MSVGKCPHVNNNNKGNEQASTWFQLINERKGQKKKNKKTNLWVFYCFMEPSVTNSIIRLKWCVIDKYQYMWVHSPFLFCALRCIDIEGLHILVGLVLVYLFIVFGWLRNHIVCPNSTL